MTFLILAHLFVWLFFFFVFKCKKGSETSHGQKAKDREVQSIHFGVNIETKKSSFKTQDVCQRVWLTPHRRLSPATQAFGKLPFTKCQSCWMSCKPSHSVWILVDHSWKQRNAQIVCVPYSQFGPPFCRVMFFIFLQNYVKLQFERHDQEIKRLEAVVEQQSEMLTQQAETIAQLSKVGLLCVWKCPMYELNYSCKA